MTDDIFKRLAAPFLPSEVDWRVGPTNLKDANNPKGLALAYIDARTVMARLDAVCGPAGWQNRYVMEGTKTVCEIGVKCGEEWIYKADGAGDSDMEAEKGALSDAFKRAAVRWGVGRYLYDVKSPWVAIRAFGKSYVIADEARDTLDRILRVMGAGPEKANGSAPSPVPEPLAAAPKVQTPQGWTQDSIAEVKACKTRRDVERWNEGNSVKLMRLKKMNEDLFASLQDAIDVKLDSFSNLAAG